MISNCSASRVPVPSSIMTDGPDFDAYIERVAREASVLPRPAEALFTFALIFSITLTPFVMFQAMAPDLMTMAMTSAWSLSFIPYVVFTTIMGMKIASVFGCKAWRRITSPLVK